MSLNSQDNIVLFAFRKSQKEFFKHVLQQCSSKNLKIISAKHSWMISFKALKDIKEVDFNGACSFAIDEFYAKTNLKIPMSVLKVYFNTFARINFLRYSAALDADYTKMLIWNGGKFRQLIALEVAKIKKIKVYFFENGLLPNTIVFDEKGINYKNSVPRDKDFFQNYNTEGILPTSLVPRIGKDRNIFKGNKDKLPEKYIFVPFQVDYDTQIISQSCWIKNMRMLFNVIDTIAKKSSYHFILKEHPSSGIEYPELHLMADTRQNVSFKNRHSTQELIENSMAVITVNSTVGIEALLFHKKVIVLGDAFYKIDGITYAAEDEEALALKVDTLETLSYDEVLIDNFLKYLYHDYLIPKNDDMYTIFCQKMLKNRL